ncbi:hypothetical protein ABEB36_006229 [Hypothenemus hampei]|uniref:Cilia- and flagella-associated protein 36 n=1 Tax=Hypothenemus hampei TaxID=57062 RepID=A0ABD1EPT3_HYPHA
MSKEEDSWVFDSLVAFLNGPIWNAPLQSFIEEKSLIFEPNESDNDDYKKIFEEFKSLVDFMLGNFMEDIGIVPEQFQNACIETKNHVSFDNNLFEQIWAANDYGMFVRMMTRRNVELQLQALELIEKKYGITPQSFVPSSHKPILEREEASSDQSANRTTAERESKLEKEILDEVAKRFAEEDTSCTIFPSTSSSEINEVLEEKSILEEQLKTVSDGETSPGKPFAVMAWN